MLVVTDIRFAWENKGKVQRNIVVTIGELSRPSKFLHVPEESKKTFAIPVKTNEFEYMTADELADNLEKLASQLRELGASENGS